MEGSSLSVRKGAWTEKEDTLLKECIEKYGEENGIKFLPEQMMRLKSAGLNRCRKSCRLSGPLSEPYIKRGAFAADEVDLIIIRLHNLLEKVHGLKKKTPFSRNALRNREGKWHKVPSRAGWLKSAGLNRCRKSCRLRWTNYLNPNIKRGAFAADEVDLIIRLHNLLGNRWSLIAGRLPGRTANDVKNYFNTHLSKKKVDPSSDPNPHLNPSFRVIKPRPLILSKKSFPVLLGEDKKTNTTATTTLASNNISESATGGNNIGYCFPGENDEVMWWDNLMMNEKEVDYLQDSMNNFNPSVLEDWHINEEMDCSTTCHLDELYLDGELWNVFNQ
ncbi:hypothetical protein GQ457_08G014930 [Hibiscus cannabinus]